MSVRQVLGHTVRAFPPASGKGPVVILLAELAEKVGFPPVPAWAFRHLPKRLREAVTRGPGAAGLAVPIRWVVDLAGLDVDDVPRELHPLWQAARAYSKRTVEDEAQP